MRRILLALILLLTSCGDPHYRVMRCSEKDDHCILHSVKFKTLKECERFVEKADQIQFRVLRMCVEQ